jgi:hypothetical protein
MERFTAPPILLIAALWVVYTSAETCYYYDGTPIDGQQFCPGTSQCCSVTAACTRNRLCNNTGETELVRGPCAITPWNSTGCATICLYCKAFLGDRDSLMRSLKLTIVKPRMSMAVSFLVLTPVKMGASAVAMIQRVATKAEGSFSTPGGTLSGPPERLRPSRFPPLPRHLQLQQRPLHRP